MHGNPDGNVPSLREEYKKVRDGGKLRVLIVHGIANQPFGPENKFQERFGVQTYEELNKHIVDWEHQSGAFRCQVIDAIKNQHMPDFVQLVT